MTCLVQGDVLISGVNLHHENIHVFVIQQNVLISGVALKKGSTVINID